MVKIEFIDGTEETVEFVDGIWAPFKYLDGENAYLVPGINGFIRYPKEFVKSIREIAV